MLGKLLQVPAAPAGKPPPEPPSKRPPPKRDLSTESVEEEEAQDKVPLLPTITTMERYRRNEEVSQQVQQRLREGSQGYVVALGQRERYVGEAAARYAKAPPTAPPDPSADNQPEKDGAGESGACSETAVPGDSIPAGVSDQATHTHQPRTLFPPTSKPAIERMLRAEDKQSSSEKVDTKGAEASSQTAEESTKPAEESTKPAEESTKTAEESTQKVEEPSAESRGDGPRATAGKQASACQPEDSPGGLPKSSNTQEAAHSTDPSKPTPRADERPASECISKRHAGRSGGAGGDRSGVTEARPASAARHTFSSRFNDTDESRSKVPKSRRHKESRGRSKSAERSEKKGQGTSKRRSSARRSQPTARNDSELAAYICALSVAEWHRVLESRVLTENRLRPIK
ncbi:hypothetical protein CSUI_004564 [Cystoisospora suis]|uniref:Uncharacterized protein n=1 Tax=Cystoisospora suis TaxID=483139 RepID=A0A2C6KWU7_9APIC|nr:hypothetical protein CSUI_004564 [Cystoisospora suis]